MDWIKKQEGFREAFGFVPEIPTPGTTRTRFEKEAVYLVLAGLAYRALAAQKEQQTEQGFSILGLEVPCDFANLLQKKEGVEAIAARLEIREMSAEHHALVEEIPTMRDEFFAANRVAGNFGFKVSRGMEPYVEGTPDTATFGDDAEILAEVRKFAEKHLHNEENRKIDAG